MFGIALEQHVVAAQFLTEIAVLTNAGPNRNHDLGVHAVNGIDGRGKSP